MTSGLPADRNHMARTNRQWSGEDEVTRLRKLVAMCSHLSATAAQQAEIDTVTKFLATSTGSSIAVIDRELEVLAAAGSSDPADVVTAVREQAGAAGLSSVLAAAARNRRALTVPGYGRAASVVVAPVSVGDEVAGYLLAIGDSHDSMGEDMMLLASEHGAMVCGVLLGRELVVTAAAGRARRELVEGLLLARGDDDGEAARWARHLGYDDSCSHAVLTISLAADGRPEDHAVVENVLARVAGDVIVAARPDEVVAVVPAADRSTGAIERAGSVAARCIADLRKRGLAVGAVGIGNECRPAVEIARSYSEARRAAAAGERLGEPGAVTRFADLGIHRLLLRFPDVGELRAFGREVVGRLIDEEEATGMKYLTTLSVYFDENSSPSRTAQRLHVHPNTVSYRIRRIEEITGLRLDVHRDRLLAEVAVEILDGLRNGR